MINSRTGLLSENRTNIAIKNAITVNREFKNRQKFSAKSGLLGYFTESANQWDLHETLSGSGTVTISITFTGDGSQAYPFVQPYVDIFFGGTSDSNRPDPIFFGWSSEVDFAFIDNYPKPDLTHAEDKLIYIWTMAFDYSGTFDYYLKAYTMGSSHGMLTVIRVS